MSIKKLVFVLIGASWSMSSMAANYMAAAPLVTGETKDVDTGINQGTASPDANPQTPDEKAPGTKVISPFSCPNGLEYVPLPAFSAPNYSVTTLDASGTPKTETKNWPTNAKQINKLLPNIETKVTINDLGASASGGGIFGVSLEREKITIDFMKYRSEPISAYGNNPAFYSRIGAGMRLEFTVETSDTDLGGSLMAIAASAKAGHTTGFVSADIIGVDANDLTVAMPFTTDLSDASIQKVIEALAIIKSKLNDENTNLEPQFIAKIQCAKPAAVAAK